MLEVPFGRCKEGSTVLSDMPAACLNYSVTELVMTGLSVSIALWKYIPAHIDFDCYVDHLAMTLILKSNGKPASHRIDRLL